MYKILISKICKTIFNKDKNLFQRNLIIEIS